MDDLSKFAQLMKEGSSEDLDEISKRLKEWAGRPVNIRLKDNQGKGNNLPAGKEIKGIEPGMVRGFRGPFVL